MWEAITAIATLGTGLAIALTVLLGVRQIRMTGEQIQQLRRATQLDGTMKIFDDLLEPKFMVAMAFVLNELPERMHDPKFRAELPHIQHAGDDTHKELIVLRYLERVGTYVKNGLVDGTVIYDLKARHIIEQWNALQDVISIHRESKGRALWENFELLYDGAISYAARHGSGYLAVADVPAPNREPTDDAAGNVVAARRIAR